MADNGDNNGRNGIYVAPDAAPPDRHPPLTTVGPIGWLRANLFSGLYNTLATIIMTLLVGWFVWEMLDWSVVHAQWGVVFNNLRQLFSGYYATSPSEGELWRIELVAGILVLLTGLGLGIWAGVARSAFIAVLVILAIVLGIPIIGARIPEPSVYTSLVEPIKTPKDFLFVGYEDQEVTITLDPLDNPADAETPYVGFLEKQSRAEWSTRSRAATKYQERVALETQLAESGELLPTLAAFSPNGRNAVMTGFADHAPLLWDVNDETAIRRFQAGHTAPITSLAYSASGDLVVTGSLDGSVIVWSVEFGRVELRLEGGHTGPVYSTVFSPDDTQVLSAGEDGELILWDVADGQISGQYQDESSDAYRVVFHPDGTLALSGHADGSVLVWDLDAGEVIEYLDEHNEEINGLAFNRQGDKALSASADGTLILWDIATGDDIQLFAGHTDAVLDVAFNRDGSRAVSGSADGTLIVWNVATGSIVRQFGEDKGAIESVGYSRNGQQIITGSADRTLTLWNANNGNLLVEYEGVWDDVGNETLRFYELDLAEYNLELTVRLQDAEGNVLDADGKPAEFTLSPGEDARAITLQLPDDGWYMVDIERNDAINGNRRNNRGYGWLIVDGIELYSVQESATRQREEEFGVPPADCNDTQVMVQCAQERDFRFEGTRTFEEFVSLQLSPFFARMDGTLLVGALLFFGGWALGKLGGQQRLLRRTVLTSWIVAFPVVFIILYGFNDSSVLPRVPTSFWGGFLLTMLLTFVGITASFPLGVGLALGRRSHLPVIKWICTFFIEVVRGVPLITILFMAKHIVPFFWSALASSDLMIPRMMVGLTLFSAAYLAENVRGGLQIVPKGQIEAAHALGMNPLYTTTFIVLPQALRAVIPAIMGQFISLFKDTSLVAALFVFDLVGIVQNIVTTEIYRPYKREAYIFIAIIYFIVSYVMSDASRRLEATGSGSVRN
ncbi:MAG: ABC transporter permease subunit [Chloroflexi bacterium]|nr:ABC transporter permease subunit [Chloroflexota bacterium]